MTLLRIYIRISVDDRSSLTRAYNASSLRASTTITVIASAPLYDWLGAASEAVKRAVDPSLT